MIGRMNHIGIAVPSIEKAFETYRNLYGATEFVQPFDMPRRDVIQQNTLLGAPTYRWLPAKSRISSSFLMFYARTPTGMMQVDDVTLEGGTLTIVDRASGRTLTLAASRPL